MKTIEQIIENQNYTRLTSALDARVKEIAEKVRILLDQLQENEVCGYYIVTLKANSGFSIDYLACDYDEFGSSLEHERSDYFCGDFNYKITPATNKQKLEFLNMSKEIFETLDEWKEKYCADIEKALKETEQY